MDISSFKQVKLVVTVPASHADAVRKALGDAGAGKLGEYDHCSISVKVIGRYKGSEKSHPAIGSPNIYESVEEERIEVNVDTDKLPKVISQLKKVHPYEEPSIDIYPLLT